MTGWSGNAPVWLFSFVDLAFLLLIAMTQLGADGKPGAPDLGEVVVPRIRTEAAADLPSNAGDRWQLRIHAAEGDRPFELVRGDERTKRLDVAAMREQLAALDRGRGSVPLLAPHENSRSGDLLAAVAAIETHWAGRRRATVAPVSALR